MKKCSRFSILLATAIIAATSASYNIASESQVNYHSQNSTLSLTLPYCEKDAAAWGNFSPYDEWMAERGRNPRGKMKPRSEYARERATYNKHWKKLDAVDKTWIDIDGDGWCDVITSGDEEPYKYRKDKPTLLLSPRGIYMRTPSGFKSYKPGMITGEYEGVSFTAYWDTEAKATLLVQRVYQGNLVGAGGDGDSQFHLRHMLRASFEALAAGNRPEYWDYHEEAAPFFYNRAIPEDTAWAIWEEEARRAGVRDKLLR